MYAKYHSTIFPSSIGRTLDSCLISLPIPRSALTKKSVIYDRKKYLTIKNSEVMLKKIDFIWLLSY